MTTEPEESGSASLPEESGSVSMPMPEPLSPELVRVELDSLRDGARSYPRDEAKVLRESLAELDMADVKDARGRPIYFYSIPYREWDAAKGRYRVQPVEGPSITAAMSLARRWGNCRVRSHIVAEDVNGWTLEGVFIDLETGFAQARPVRALKYIQRRDGRIQKLDLNRQTLALQKGASIAMRNVVLRSLPAYLCNAYTRKAMELTAGKLGELAKSDVVVASTRVFAEKLGVHAPQLEEYLEVPVAKWTGEHVAQLRGLYAAIIDGQVTVEEVFGTAGEVPAEAVEEKPARGPAQAMAAAKAAAAVLPAQMSAPAVAAPPTVSERLL